MPTARANNNDTGSFSFLEYAEMGENVTLAGGSPRVDPLSTHHPAMEEDAEQLMPASMQMHYCTNCTGVVFDSVCVDCGHNRNEDNMLLARPALLEPQPVASTSDNRTPVIIWDDQMTAHDEGVPRGSPHPER
jgi:hypothetical protein